MSDWRPGELRQALGFVRGARAALAAGDLARAFRCHTLAANSLSLARSFAVCGVTSTATLSRVLRDLGDDIQEALREATLPVDVTDLVDEIAAGVDILRTRDGVEMDEGAALERGRNIATRLLGRWRFTRIAEEASTASTGISGGNNGEKTNPLQTHKRTN